MFYIIKIEKGLRHVIDETKSFKDAEYLVGEYQISCGEHCKVFHSTRKGGKRNANK